MKKIIYTLFSMGLVALLMNHAQAEGQKKSVRISSGNKVGAMWSGDGLGFVNQFGSAGVLQTNITIPAAGAVSTDLATQVTTPPNATVTFETTTPEVCTVSGSTMTSRTNGDCVVTITTGEVFANMTSTPKVYPVAASTTNITLKLTGQVLIDGSPLTPAEQLIVTGMGVTGVTNPKATPVNTEGQSLNLNKAGGNVTYKAYKASPNTVRYNGNYPAAASFTGTMPDLNWAAGASLTGPVLGTGQYDFVAAKFEGYILWPGTFKADSRVEFYDVCDDGFRLKVAQTAGANATDFATVVENYIDQGPGSWWRYYNAKGSATRKAGSVYKFTIDYYEYGGHATCALFWDKGIRSTFDWTTKTLVPAASFATSATQWNAP
ncbi:hypothetical protein MCESTEH50_01394 [Candidatus Methylopumilus universalis]|uniref:hypothetical protein n=1 Tax=Candidatus Methylopumilus universalis TaxID=2588536 RepID=UPI003BEF4487